MCGLTVAPMIPPSSTEQSKAIQQRTGQTFHVATRFLPERTREATYVLYAFFRIADEVVDDPDPDPPEIQRARLERIREAALGVRDTDDPIVDAFATVREQSGIPRREVDYFIDSMQADIDGEPYGTYEDLERYLRGSAVAVAYMMLAVMDPPLAERARPHARALGEAFQLTNFLRDVREDSRSYDRIYIPRETLHAHGIDISTIEEERYSVAFKRAIEVELARTEQRYRKGVAGIEYLPADCQFPVLLAAVMYAEHHRKIRAIACNVLEQRPTLGYRDYVRLVPLTWIAWRRHRDPEAVFYRVSAVQRYPDGITSSHAVAGRSQTRHGGTQRVVGRLQRWRE